MLSVSTRELIQDATVSAQRRHYGQVGKFVRGIHVSVEFCYCSVGLGIRVIGGGGATLFCRTSLGARCWGASQPVSQARVWRSSVNDEHANVSGSTIGTSVDLHKHILRCISRPGALLIVLCPAQPPPGKCACAIRREGCRGGRKPACCCSV